MKILREEDYLHYFLIGLDTPYASTREKLLTKDTLPSLNNSYQTIVKAERLCLGENSMPKDERENAMAFKVQYD